MQPKSKIDITLLYVEDEEIIRSAIEKFLRRKIDKVYIAQDGEEGLELFKIHSPDIVISDIKMPKKTGLEMAKEIKEIDKDTPIVFTTAHTDYEIMVEAIEVGVDKYVTKPIDLVTLENTIKRFSDNILLKKKVNEQSADLKKQSQLLHEYKLAIDASAIVSKTNAKGIITYVNDAFCKISKYSREELIGKAHNIVRSPDVKADVFKNLWDTILAKKVWRGIIKNKAKDSSAYYTDTTITPILNHKGEIEEFISIRYDITNNELQRRKREKSIILSKTKIFESGKQRELIFQKKIDELRMIIEQKNKKIKTLEDKVNVLNEKSKT